MFSRINLHSGYYQIHIAEGDQKKNCFLHVVWIIRNLGDAIVTLALDSQLRQRGCKVAGQKEA